MARTPSFFLPVGNDRTSAVTGLRFTSLSLEMYENDLCIDRAGCNSRRGIMGWHSYEIWKVGRYADRRL